MKYNIKCVIHVVDEAGEVDADKSEFTELVIDTDATMAAAAAYVENCPADLGLVSKEDDANVVVTLLSVSLVEENAVYEISAEEIDRALSLDPDAADSDEDVGDGDSDADEVEIDNKKVH